MIKNLLLASALLVSCSAFAQEAPQQNAAAQGGRWSYQTPIDEQASDPETCRLKLERYRQSLACFQPYRYGRGLIRPEAFQHCTDYPQPVECMTQH